MNQRKLPRAKLESLVIIITRRWEDYSIWLMKIITSTRVTQIQNLIITKWLNSLFSVSNSIYADSVAAFLRGSLLLQITSKQIFHNFKILHHYVLFEYKVNSTLRYILKPTTIESNNTVEIIYSFYYIYNVCLENTCTGILHTISTVTFNFGAIVINVMKEIISVL